jgi:transposase
VSARTLRGGDRIRQGPVGLPTAEAMGCSRGFMYPSAEGRLAGRRPDAPSAPASRAIAKAIDYLIKRWAAFTRFLDDGRVCLSNNAAERALRGVAVGKKAWLFAVPTTVASAPPRCTR